jgi:hypothetical protein
VWSLPILEQSQTQGDNMIHTDEDDEFERIAHEAEMKKGQPYHYDVFVSPSQRNTVLEEVAKEFDKMPFGDTAASFACFVRNMKK